nr:unnamed protein product [Callosobruchus analis]
MSNHSEAADSDNLSLCIHCNATFKSKTSLDDHTIREHPDFIASVSCKVHECPCCTYKTTVKGSFDRHMLKHPETVDSYKLSVCVHCDAKFKSKTSLDSHTIREHPDFIVSVSSKIHACAHCPYKTVMKANLDRHMSKHPESAVNYNLSICVHCNATYKSKKNLDDHIIRKHPDCIESISSKIHECTHCTYKTTVKGHLTEHMMLKHPETADNYKLKICVHCNATFKSKASLDNHTVREHPDFVASVSNKLHECAHCTYKTTLKSNFSKHMMLEHPETADSGQLITCTHCEAKFKSKQKLDEHTLKKHPDLIASVSSKIHECIYCTYKTTRKDVFLRHMEDHPEAEDSYQHSTCIHCNAVFKRKRSLDDHIVRKHPDFIAFVSSKIHECTHCSYKTAMKANLNHHMLKHPETADSYRYIACVHCNATLRCLHCEATFKRKTGLDNHVIRKHPHFIASVSSKMHECTYCTYKTTMKSNFAKHLIKKHPKIADSNNLVRCIHCNATYKSRTTLNDHVIHNHPDFIASISSKIYQCKYCTYKTTRKSHFVKHSLVHPETVDSHKLSKCIHCNAIYKHKIGLDDHILRQHPELIASVSSKMHECTHCAFKTVLKANLALHMLEHHETADRCKFSTCVHCNTTFIHKQALSDHILHVMKHPEIADSNKLIRCNHCNSTFKSKPALNDHIINRHPDFMASISSKIHQCKYCTHMLAHPETADSRKLNKCIRCNTEYKHKIGLDEHILRQHPELIASVSNKMHECTHCAFKTVFKDNLTVHMVEHHETADICKFSTCVHCNTTFIDKQALSDHIHSKHPGSIGSVSRKIYECTLCAFKTVSKLNSDRHMLEHPEMVDRCTFRTCVQCNATFKSRQGLNDHTLKKHPESIGSISSKIYECPQCTFKTVMKSYLTRHMLKHPETADRCKFSACVHCNATFKSKPSLVDHTLRKHPDSVESNSIRIYECTHCAYKTCLKRSFTKHILKHP